MGPWFWIPALDQSPGCDVTARLSHSEQRPWLLFESLFDFLSLSEQAAVRTELISFGPHLHAEASALQEPCPHTANA